MCIAGYQRNAQDECVPCDAGKYRPDGAPDVTCSSCPILGGARSDPGSAGCTCTMPGFYWKEANHTCAKCGSDKFRAAGDPQECSDCPMFSQSSEGSGSCDCQPAGYKWDAATRNCTACAANEYRPAGDPQSCSKCPNNGMGDIAKSAPGSGSCNCTTAGQYWSTGSRNCANCNQGGELCR